MERWNTIIGKERDIYSRNTDYNSIKGYLLLSLEARLRNDRHIIHGTVRGQDYDASSETIEQLLPDEKLGRWYKPLFEVTSLDDGILVTSHQHSLDSPIKEYCEDISREYDLNIIFTSLSQTSSHPHQS